MAKFIGRERELKKLKSLLTKRAASLVVMRGRRRIGKTRLIREFGKSLPCHIFSGLPPTKETTKEGQIREFCAQIERAFGTPRLNAEDWGGVFWQLGQLCATGRMMLALDEISWIGSKDPDFLGQLKNAWDLYFSTNQNLILIVCGSVSSWIEKNILSNTGFVGRITMNLHLKELPMSDSMKFCGKKAQRISPQDVLKVLSVTGGVPRYLEEIHSERSAEENIRAMAFEADGLLFLEFEQIFSDLFSSGAPSYQAVVEYLVGGARQLPEVAAAINRSTTRASVYLRDLIAAGFASEDPTWNLKTMKTSKLKKYRLSDNYVRFYLKYIKPYRKSILQRALESVSLADLSGWNSMMGLQFENLVLSNVHSLLPLIGVKPSELLCYGPFFQRQTNRRAGCQVDLLVQTRFRTVHLCEIKFSSQPVGMNTVYAIEDKVDRLALPKGWSIRTAIIHVNGVTDEVRQSESIDHVVDFCTLMHRTAS